MKTYFLSSPMSRERSRGLSSSRRRFLIILVRMMTPHGRHCISFWILILASCLKIVRLPEP